MQRLEVDPSELVALADTLEKTAATMAVDLDRLADATDQLRLEWQGEAQHAFDVVQTRNRADLDERRLALIRLAVAARRLARAYGETDRAASRGLGGQ
jgi:WXG100 family type VII secretion target